MENTKKWRKSNTRKLRKNTKNKNFCEQFIK